MEPGPYEREVMLPSVPGPGEVERTLAAIGEVATVVLVEGDSDRVALRVLAARTGLDLAAASVEVVSMGGVTNIGHFVAAMGPQGRGLTLCGLCDERERPIVARALQRHGVAGAAADDDLERWGFFTCHADLEDELIRAAGIDGVERMLEGEGELDSFRRFQRQPAQRDVPVVAQLHRFIGTRATRKSRAAQALAEQIPLTAVPRPLAALLDRLR